MPMTVNEANSINVLLCFIFDIGLPYMTPPDEGDVKRAAAILADGASRRLRAGVHVADVGNAGFRVKEVNTKK